MTSGVDFLVVALWFLGAGQRVPDVQVSNSLRVLSNVVCKAAPKSCPPHLHFLCSTVPLERPWVSCILELGTHGFDKQKLSKFIEFFLIPLC